MLRRALLTVSALALILGITAGALSSAEAAPRAGKGGTGAVITFSQNPVPVGTDYQITVSGVGANKWVTVGATYDGWTYWVSGQTDANGTVVLTTTARTAGSIAHQAMEQGNNGSLRLKATATLTVTG